MPKTETTPAGSTDAHVVSPIFFPGGDIGRLAVYGTVTDVAMLGARPLYLSAAFILAEGFPLATLRSRLAGYTRGDTDLAWARCTQWRSVVAAVR